MLKTKSSRSISPDPVASTCATCACMTKTHERSLSQCVYMCARLFVCKRTHIRTCIGFTIFCSWSCDILRPRPSIILPSSSMSMWPLLIPRCHLAHCQQIRSKTRAIFSEFRPAVFVEKLEYPLEIFNLFFTQDSVRIYDFLVVYRLFLAYTMPKNEMTNEWENKQKTGSMHKSN